MEQHSARPIYQVAGNSGEVCDLAERAFFEPSVVNALRNPPGMAYEEGVNHMKTTVLTVLATVALAAVAPAAADTCDTEHGCSVTCPDGCIAIYWFDTGKCTVACTDKARSLAKKYRSQYQSLGSRKIAACAKGLAEGKIYKDCR